MTQNPNDPARAEMVRKLIEYRKEMELDARPGVAVAISPPLHRLLNLAAMADRIARKTRLLELRGALASWRRRHQGGGG